jgi:LmbE family N-acetylglucosaminyl deacetylase
VSGVEIFYSPHADDESIAMAGAIARAKAAGCHVVLVLVTDTLASPRGTALFRDELRCPWHGGKHDLQEVELRGARLMEFFDASIRLGVDEVSSLGIPEHFAEQDFSRFVDALGFTLQRYATQYPDAIHHVVAGDRDVHAETGQGNAAHRGLAAAATRIAELRSRLHFHRVYTYSHPIGARGADQVITLTADEMSRKIRALRAYALWEPVLGRIAFGYHSVPELIDAAASDPREFVDLAA